MILNPDAGMSFKFLFSFSGFIVLVVNIVLMIKNNSRKDAEGVVKANLKLDGLCKDSSETRLDLKTMRGDLENVFKKQLEHDFRFKQVEQDIYKLNERVDNIEEKASQG